MRDFLLALLTCSVTMSALALLYMALTPILARRYAPAGRYYAWLIIVVGLIIPYRPQLGEAIVEVDVPREVAIVQAAREPSYAAATFGFPADAAALPAAPSAPAQSAMAGVSAWQVAFALWLSGALAFAAIHLLRHVRFMKTVARWSEPAAADARAALDGLRAEMGVARSVALKRCSCIGSPMLTGFFRPRILLPCAEAAGEEGLSFMLRHELVHLRRGDLWYKALMLLANAIHWFNPIVYLMNRAVAALCELSCDARTLGGGDLPTRLRYSEAVLGVARRQSRLRTALSTSFYGGKKGMRVRIASIMDAGGKWLGVLLMCAALAATAATGCVLAANAPQPPEDAAPKDALGQMMEHRIDYVGDASGVGKLLSFLPQFDPNYVQNMFAVRTDDDPANAEPVHYLYIYYEPSEGFGGEDMAHPQEMATYAHYLFACVGNLDVVHYKSRKTPSGGELKDEEYLGTSLAVLDNPASEAWRTIGEMAAVSTSLPIADYHEEILKLCGGEPRVLFDALSAAFGDHAARTEAEPAHPLYPFARDSLEVTSQEIYCGWGVNPGERMYADLSAKWEAVRDGVTERLVWAHYYLFYELPDPSAVTVAERDGIIAAVKGDMQAYIEGLSDDQRLDGGFADAFAAELARVTAALSTGGMPLSFDVYMIDRISEDADGVQTVGASTDAVESRPYDVGTFHALSVRVASKDGVDIVLRPGEPGVTVSAAKADLDALDVSVSPDGTLSIGNEGHRAKGVSIAVSVRDLRAADVGLAAVLSGSGKFAGDALTLSASQASQIALTAEYGEIRAVLGGASDMILEGACENIALEIDGASNADTRDMAARHVVAEVSGASVAALYARETLDITAAGASEVAYSGGARVTRDVSGMSTVREWNE